MSLPSDLERSGLVPQPVALAGMLLVGVAAVLALPELAPHLPRAGRPEQATYATTCLGVVALSCAYLYAVGQRTKKDRPWLLWTGGYNAGIVIVKFILSPAAFEKSTTSLGRFVATGLIVMPLYIAALAVLYRAATRRRTAWAWPSRISFALGLAAAAVATRVVAAAALGTTSEYLHDLAGGIGLILPSVVGVGALAVMEAFHRAGPALRTAFSFGVVLVLVEHALWVVYMNRLFS